MYLTYFKQIVIVLIALFATAGRLDASIALTFSSVDENSGAGDYRFHVFTRNTSMADFRIASFNLPFDVKSGFVFGGIEDFSVQHPEDSDGVFPMKTVNTNSPFFSVLFNANSAIPDEGLMLGSGETGKLFNFTLSFDGSQSGLVEAASLVTSGPGALFYEIVVDPPGSGSVAITTEGLSPSIGVTSIPEPSSLFFCSMAGAILMMSRRRVGNRS